MVREQGLVRMVRKQQEPVHLGRGIPSHSQEALNTLGCFPSETCPHVPDSLWREADKQRAVHQKARWRRGRRSGTHRAGDGAAAGRTGKRGGGPAGRRARPARNGCNRPRPPGCTAPAAFASPARRWCGPRGLVATPAAKAKGAD